MDIQGFCYIQGALQRIGAKGKQTFVLMLDFQTYDEPYMQCKRKRNADWNNFFEPRLQRHAYVFTRKIHNTHAFLTIAPTTMYKYTCKSLLTSFQFLFPSLLPINMLGVSEGLDLLCERLGLTSAVRRIYRA